MKARGSSLPKVFAAALAVGLCSLSSVAAASTKVVVAAFEGRKADVLRGRVITSLEEAGHSVTVSDSGDDARELARRVGAKAVVEARVERPGMREWRVLIEVVDPGNGEAVGDEVVFESSWLPGLAKELTDTAGDRLAGQLEQLEEKEGQEAEASVDDDAPLLNVDPEVIPEADRGSESGVSVASEDGGMFRIRAKAGWMRRTFLFADDIYSRLGEQRSNSWVYSVDAAVYPFTRPVGDRLGIIAGYEGTLSGSVSDPSTRASYNVTYYELFAGLRARYPLDANEVGFDLTLGRMHAGLDAPTVLTELPDLDYTAVRAVMHGIVSMGIADLTLGAGFRLPLGYGEIGSDPWFPRIGGYGVEAHAALVYPLGAGVALEASGMLRRFVLEANAEPEDALQGTSETAAGAVDLYLSTFFGVSFRL